MKIKQIKKLHKKLTDHSHPLMIKIKEGLGEHLEAYEAIKTSVKTKSPSFEEVKAAADSYHNVNCLVDELSAEALRSQINPDFPYANISEKLDDIRAYAAISRLQLPKSEAQIANHLLSSKVSSLVEKLGPDYSEFYWIALSNDNE